MQVTRRPLVALDAALGVACSIALWIEAEARGHLTDHHVLVALVTLAVGAGVAARRRHAVLVLALVLGLLLVELPLTHSTHASVVVAMLLSATVAYEGRRWVTLAVGVALVPLVSLAWYIAGGDGVGQEFFTYLVLVLASVAAGDAVQARRQAKIERQAREQAARSAAARELFDEYRLQLGRELHDSLAHALVAITTRAGVAAHLRGADGDPDLLSALVDVKTASAEALEELRTALEALRTDGEPAPGAPGLGSLAALDALVRPLSAAGLHVELHCDPEATQAPPYVGHAGYRIVQESLTNVLRHAGAVTVCISVTVRGSELSIDVANDGPVARRPAGSGHGLLGMQERTRDLGGTVSAGPQPQGGWRVSAQLPLRA